MQTKLLLLRKILPSNRKQPRFVFSTDQPTNEIKTDDKTTVPKTFFQRFFGPQTYIASPKFKKRWLMVIPCFLSNLCIGSPYAWSLVASIL